FSSRVAEARRLSDYSKPGNSATLSLRALNWGRCAPRGRVSMECSRCQQENPPQARFCMKCGASVTLACGNCRTELPAGAAFCFSCGRPVGPTPAREPRFTAPESYTPKHLAERILTSKAALEGERKQVTVLFADLKGSMELLADRDPEEARRLLDPVLEHMME